MATVTKSIGTTPNSASPGAMRTASLDVMGKTRATNVLTHTRRRNISLDGIGVRFQIVSLRNTPTKLSRRVAETGGARGRLDTLSFISLSPERSLFEDRLTDLKCRCVIGHKSRASSIGPAVRIHSTTVTLTYTSPSVDLSIRTGECISKL